MPARWLIVGRYEYTIGDGGGKVKRGGGKNVKKVEKVFYARRRDPVKSPLVSGEDPARLLRRGFGEEVVS